MGVLPSDYLSQLTKCRSVQANKHISQHCLAQDINVLQNLRGLLERGVQESFDSLEKVGGTDKIMLEAVFGYAGSIRTALWNEIEEDHSKVHLDLDGLLHSLTWFIPGIRA